MSGQLFIELMSLSKRSKGLGFLVVVITFSALYLWEDRGPNQESQKFHEVEKLWAALPLYPGMIELSHSSNSSGRKASQGAKFKSEAKYDEVKQFYAERLPQQGWILQREKSLSNWGRNQGGQELEWRKDEYLLSIEYSGQPGFEWNYAVGIYWYDR